MNIVVWVIIIFLARICDVSLGTLRVQMIVRRKKYLAGIIGFFEVMIFIVIVANVIRNFYNIWAILAYCTGFGAGTIVGISISELINKDLLCTTVISPSEWINIEDKLRGLGFGVTAFLGRGKGDKCYILRIICKEKDFGLLKKEILSIDTKAVIYSQLLIDMKGGYLTKIRKGK